MRIALGIDETLSTISGAKQGLLDFLDRMTPGADASLDIMGQSNLPLVPFTADINAHVRAITAMPVTPRRQNSQVAEGIGDLARRFMKTPHPRPVIVVISYRTTAFAVGQPRAILTDLGDSGAQLHVVLVSVGSLGDTADLELSRGHQQVLNDGSRQSGGRQWEVGAFSAIPQAMDAIARELSNQYAITYTLPDGVRPSERVAVSVNRRGVTLRAPTRIPDR